MICLGGLLVLVLVFVCLLVFVVVVVFFSFAKVISLLLFQNGASPVNRKLRGLRMPGRNMCLNFLDFI